MQYDKARYLQLIAAYRVFVEHIKETVAFNIAFSAILNELYEQTQLLAKRNRGEAL